MPEIITSTAGRAYLDRGWYVLPVHSVFAGVCTCKNAQCAAPGKHPLIPGGANAASNRGLDVEWWLHKWPWANLAIATGPSNLVVIDIDPRNGGDILSEHPDTLTVLTGGGGVHWYYDRSKHPTLATVHTPGVDVIASTGAVVAPPSLHASGRRYTWANAAALAQPPAWVLPRAPVRSAVMATQRQYSRPKPRIDTAALPQIPDGGRNNRLYRIGCRLVWEDRDWNDIFALLHTINAQKCVPPLSEWELRLLISSVQRRYMQHNQQFRESHNVTTTTRIVRGQNV